MNKQVRVFQIKEIHHKQRAKSYAQQIEDGFLIHHQNYQSAYKGQVGPSETPVTVRGRLEEQRPNTFIGRPFGASWTLSGARESSSAGMQCTVTAKMNGTKAGWWWMSMQQMLFVLSIAENWKA